MHWLGSSFRRFLQLDLVGKTGKCTRCVMKIALVDFSLNLRNIPLNLLKHSHFRWAEKTNNFLKINFICCRQLLLVKLAEWLSVIANLSHLENTHGPFLLRTLDPKFSFSWISWLPNKLFQPDQVFSDTAWWDLSESGLKRGILKDWGLR